LVEGRFYSGERGTASGERVQEDEPNENRVLVVA
jgi:hypothetical protein